MAIRGYWRLGENGNDDSGNGYNFTNYNSVSYSQSRLNLGANFGTSNTNRKLEVASNLGIDGGSMTMMCWVKLNTGGFNGASILSTMSATSKVQYAIRTNNTSGFYFARTRRGVVDDYYLLSSGLSINTWYHVALTYNGTTITAYLNGKAIGTKAASGNGTATVASVTAIGYQIETTLFGNYIVDEAIIDNRAWSATEMKNKVAADLGFF